MNPSNKEKKGLFINVQYFSENDGNGLQTTVFMAGCPLRCKWCANPESYAGENRIAYDEGKCIGCNKCLGNCINKIGKNLNTLDGRKQCINCGSCLELCQVGARKIMVEEKSLKEIVETVLEHKIFYRYSNGGVTFSGGEPFFQLNVLEELSRELYDLGISLTIETSGFWDYKKCEDILKRMDLIFIDLKAMDDSIHKKYTGVSNEKILNNIREISKLNIETVVRIPLIEGVNATNKNIIESAKFVKNNFKKPKIELLPYHNFGEEKYNALYLEIPPKEFKRPSKERISELEALISNEGVEVVHY